MECHALEQSEWRREHLPYLHMGWQAIEAWISLQGTANSPNLPQRESGVRVIGVPPGMGTLLFSVVKVTCSPLGSTNTAVLSSPSKGMPRAFTCSMSLPA